MSKLQRHLIIHFALLDYIDLDIGGCERLNSRWHARISATVYKKHVQTLVYEILRSLSNDSYSTDNKYI